MCEPVETPIEYKVEFEVSKTGIIAKVNMVGLRGTMRSIGLRDGWRGIAGRGMVRGCRKITRRGSQNIEESTAKQAERMTTMRD